ncbi:hypothetical protein [Nostoc sp.]|uniref:hypothetical protein n=1 Tax=Nostoc sp. TaxID=1180 RepID=UPI002FF8806E
MQKSCQINGHPAASSEKPLFVLRTTYASNSRNPDFQLGAVKSFNVSSMNLSLPASLSETEREEQEKFRFSLPSGRRRGAGGEVKQDLSSNSRFFNGK